MVSNRKKLVVSITCLESHEFI